MLKHVEVAEALISKPERMIPVLEKALVEAQEKILREDGNGDDTLSLKPHIHPRLIGKLKQN